MSRIVLLACIAVLAYIIMSITPDMMVNIIVNECPTQRYAMQYDDGSVRIACGHLYADTAHGDWGFE